MRGSIAIGRAMSLFGALWFVLCSHVYAQTADLTVHIPAKPLADALIEFAVQARLSLSASGIDFNGAVSNAVDGRVSREEGLRRLLAGSGFDFELIDSNTVRIRVAAASVHASAHVTAPVEQVIVTATKREELADKLPYSIVVIDGDEIAAFGVRSSHGLTSRVAGLTETNLGPGQDKLFVRGLADSVLPGLSDSIVGVYLDEARIADDAPAAELRLIDVDRIEVLRGPQGSLYGAGSLGGLVRIITRKPVYDTVQMMAGASVSATAGGGMSSGLEGMLNLPLVRNELALRVVGYTDTVGGYVDDVRLGKSNANRTTVEGVRAALGWSPDATWTVVGNVVVQDIEAADSQYYLTNLGPQERDTFIREPHSDRIVQAGITASAGFGWADLTSNTSLIDRRIKSRFDASSSWPELTGLPQGPSPFDVARQIRSYTHETRLASAAAGRFQWLFGISLSHRDEEFTSDLTGPNTLGAPVVARTESREDGAEEGALFGELSYELTPSLTLAAGARLFRATHDVTAHSSGLLLDAPTRFSDSTSQQGAMPKLVLTYRPDADVTLYAQFAEGYRLGGLNVDGPPDATGEFDPDFDSDTLRNYEVGAKTSFFDARVKANIALYYVLWKNVQTDLIGPDGAFFIVNAGAVHDYGFEADITVRPISALNLQGHVFWNKADLSHSNPMLASADGVLPGAPSVSVGFSARYDMPIDEASTAFASMDYSYVGASHLGFNEETPAMGNYHLASVRIGLAHGAWTASVFVDNLTDNRGNTFAFGNPFSADAGMQATTPRPRTIGISLAWTQ